MISTLNDQKREKINLNIKIKNLCFHPLKELIYASDNSGLLILWEVSTEKIILSKKVFQTKICKMAFYKTGDYLAVILSNGEAFLLNATNFFIVATIQSQWSNKEVNAKFFKGIYLVFVTNFFYLINKNCDRYSYFNRK